MNTLTEVTVTVRSDHNPLKAIFSKPLNKAPPRLLRLHLGLRRYDLHVQYTPGTDIPVADTLSRAYLTKEQDPEIAEQDKNINVHSTLHSLPVSDTKLEEFKNETAKDQTLQHSNASFNMVLRPTRISSRML